MDSPTEATTTLDWFEAKFRSTNGQGRITETHTPALNDEDMWDWATTEGRQPRKRD